MTPEEQHQDEKVDPRSRQRMVLLRLVAKWRLEAEDWMGELGAAIDMGSRGQIREVARTLNRCARELEKTTKDLRKAPSCPRCASWRVQQIGVKRWHCCSCQKRWSVRTPKP